MTIKPETMIEQDGTELSLAPIIDRGQLTEKQHLEQLASHRSIY